MPKSRRGLIDCKNVEQKSFLGPSCLFKRLEHKLRDKATTMRLSYEEWRAKLMARKVDLVRQIWYCELYNLYTVQL